jgi:hypothetical protein
MTRDEFDKPPKYPVCGECFKTWYFRNATTPERIIEIRLEEGTLMMEPQNSPLDEKQWLPKTDDDEICGDSRAEVGEPELVCDLVKGHKCYHYNVAKETHWATGWRDMRKDWPDEDKEKLKLD